MMPHSALQKQYQLQPPSAPPQYPQKPCAHHQLASRNPRFMPPKYLSQVKLTSNSFSATKSSNQFLERLEAENQWLQEQLQSMKTRKFGPPPKMPLAPPLSHGTQSSAIHSHRKLKPLNSASSGVSAEINTDNEDNMQSPTITWRVPTALANRIQNEGEGELGYEDIDGYQVLRSNNTSPNRKAWQQLYSGQTVLDGGQRRVNATAITSTNDSNNQSLLNGQFCQADSDRSFQEALMAWRNAGSQNSTTTRVKSAGKSTETHAMSTEASTAVDSIKNQTVIEQLANSIQFNNGARSALSYLEQLELKKLRAVAAATANAEHTSDDELSLISCAE